MADEEKRDAGMNEEIQARMDFIVEQQAQFAANIQVHDDRLTRFENIVMRLAEVSLSSIENIHSQLAALTDSHIRLEEAQKKTEETLNRLAESQAHTDKRLDALIDIVREDREGRNGKS